MFTCRECYAVCEGQEKHPESPACDEFDGAESEAVDEVEPYVNDIKNLYGIAAIMQASIDELERKFDTIISAVVRAAGPEEER